MIAGVLETQFTANLDALRKGMAQAEKELRDFERRAGRASGRGSSFSFGPSPSDIRNIRQASSETSRLRGQTIGLRSAVTGLASAYAAIKGAQGFKELLDTSNRIQNALRVVGHEGESLTKVYDQLFASAQKNYTSIESLTTLYSRLGLAQNELGKTSEEILGFTDRVALALRVQGTNAQEARGALIQLTQAMGSGVVRAEEFNSIVEGAPTILRATARGLEEAGGSVAKLRTLVIEGKLSSKAFFEAFMLGSDNLSSQVERNQITIDQAYQRFQNNLINTASELDKSVGITRRVVTAFNDLTSSLDRFANFLTEKSQSINWFLDQLERMGNQSFAGTEREFKQIGDLVDKSIQGWNMLFEAMGVDVSAMVKRSLDPAAAALEEVQQRTEAAKEALIEFASASYGSTTIDPVTIDRLNDIIAKLTDGRIEAEEAREEIAMLGRMDGAFAPLIGQVNGLISVFQLLTGQVQTAKREMITVPGFTYAGQEGAPSPSGTTTSIKDNPASTKGTGRKAKTPLQNYEEEVSKMRDRIKLIDQETASVGMLNSVQETNRVRQELINAAREKGITLSEQQLRDIDAVAEAYGRSTQALDDANRALEMQLDLYSEFGSAIGDALGALISGSEDAEKALARMVLQMIQAVIQAQILNTIGQSQPAVGNLFSGIIKGIFGGGRALGGNVEAGTAYKVNESTANSEYFVPSQSGRIIPNRQMQSNSSQDGQITVRTINEFVDDHWVTRTTEIAGQVAGRQIKQSENNIGTTMMKQRLSRRPGIR